MKNLFSTFTVWAVLIFAAVFCFIGINPVMASEATTTSLSMVDMLPLLGLAGTIDIFDKRYLLDVVRQLKPPSSFLVDTFFPLSDQSDTDAVDVDILKGKRRMAPFVSPIAAGKVLDHIGFTTNTIKPGYLKPKKVTTAQQLLQRQAGEAIYSGMTPQERAEDRMAKDLVELEETITRRKEWMAAQALNAGAVTVTIKGDGGPDKTVSIDFDMPAAHKVTLAGGDLWTDIVNSDPIADLTIWSRLCRQDSGLNPTDIVLGADAAVAFINHPKVQNVLNNRRMEMGVIKPEFLPNGVSFVGDIAAPSLSITVWTYDEWYIDDAGNEQPMVPVDKTWMGSRNAKNTKLHAAIQDVEAAEAGMFAIPIYPKSWLEKDPGVRWLMLQSAPLMALNQSDAFVSAKVV